MACAYEFIANTADGAFAVDRHQTIVMWNSAAAAITGHRASDVLGKKCFSVMRGKDGFGCAICRSGCSQFAAGERLEPAAAVEMTVPTAGGRQCWLSVSTIFAPARDRELSVLLHLFREVTTRHEIDRVAHELAALVSSEPAPPTVVVSHQAGAGNGNALGELTHREREILAHLAQGETTEAIAGRLFISTHTVRNHVTSILAKLEVHSRLEAVARATKHSLLCLSWMFVGALT